MITLSGVLRSLGVRPTAGPAVLYAVLGAAGSHRETSLFESARRVDSSDNRTPCVKVLRLGNFLVFMFSIFVCLVFFDVFIFSCI